MWWTTIEVERGNHGSAWAIYILIYILDCMSVFDKTRIFLLKKMVLKRDKLNLDFETKKAGNFNGWSQSINVIGKTPFPIPIFPSIVLILFFFNSNISWQNHHYITPTSLSKKKRENILLLHCTYLLSY